MIATLNKINFLKNEKSILYGFIFFQVLLFSFLFNTRNLIQLNSMENAIFELLVIANSYWFIKKGIKRKDNVFDSKISLAIFIVLNILISFFIAGQTIFLNEYLVEISFRSFLIFFLLNLHVFPFIFNFILLLDFLKTKNNKKQKLSKKDLNIFFVTVFLFVLLVNLIVSLSFYPGNMTSDSIDIACQAMGKYGIGGGHPAFYTILLRFVFLVYNHVFAAICINIIYLSILLAYIFTYLYANGIRKRFLFITLFIFVFSWNNISLMTIFWKDIPFTISLLWLTFELYRIIKEKDNYFSSNINILRLIISLMFVYLLRVNGMFPYIVTIFYLLYYCFKTVVKKPVIITICLSIFSIWFIKGPVFDFFNVSRSSIDGGSASFAAKGLASLAYYDANLSDRDKEEIQKIAPLNVLKESYSSYNIDTMAFGTNKDIINNGIQKYGTMNIYKLYLKQLLVNPKIIIRDRLDSNNLLWDLTMPTNGFNSTYVVGIWYPGGFDPNILGLKETTPGVYLHKKNVLSDLVLGYYKLWSLSFLGNVFWRPAIPLAFLLLLIYYMMRKKIHYFPMLYPTIINIMFWVLLLSHQSYRYLWFIYVNTYFAYIIILGEKRAKS